MNVELRNEAVADLNDGAMFYESQRNGLGSYFVQSLKNDLANLSFTGGIHESELGAHRKLASKFPYAIYYRIEGNMVDVIAILDCRQDPAKIESRLSS